MKQRRIFLILLLAWGQIAMQVSFATEPQYYEVTSGDTLSGIAQRHQVTLNELASWNQISPPYTLRVGQRLRVTALSAKTTKTPDAPQPKSSDSTPPVATAPTLIAPVATILPLDATPASTSLELSPEIANLNAQINALKNEITNLRTSIWPLLGTTGQPDSDSSPYTYYPADIREIKERGKLIVMQYRGTRAGFFMYDNENRLPNFESYDDGKGRVIGYDIEIAYKLARRLGVELDLRREAEGFTQACQRVGRGEADMVLSKLVTTLDRAEYVNFSKPYVVVRLGVLINRLEETKIGEEEDPIKLCNRKDAKIAIQSGTAFIPFAQEYFPLAQLVEYPDLNATIAAVEQGEALAMLNDEWNIGSALRMNPEIGVRVRLAFIPKVKIGLAAAVSPIKPNLLSLFNLMLDTDNLATTPQYLLDRYFEKGTAAQISSSIALLSEASSVNSVNPFALIGIVLISVGLLAIWIIIAYRVGHSGHNRHNKEST